MADEVCPLEGKVILLWYTECDREAENRACLVYRVIGGQLETLFGIMDLPSEVCEWNERDNLRAVLDILTQEKVRIVYTPAYGEQFLGKNLGYFDIDSTPNEKNEIECWGELQGLSEVPNTWPLYALKEHAVTVCFVRPDTLEVID